MLMNLPNFLFNLTPFLNQNVQCYSLASGQGEAEAAMALSKWFLSNSGGAAGNVGPAGARAFEKDMLIASVILQT